MVVVCIRKMLEKGQKVSNTLGFQCNLGVIEVLGVGLGQGFYLIGGLQLFCLLHLPQFIHKFLD